MTKEGQASHYIFKLEIGNVSLDLPLKVEGLGEFPPYSLGFAQAKS
jgi:hypothetical protein